MPYLSFDKAGSKECLSDSDTEYIHEGNLFHTLYYSLILSIIQPDKILYRGPLTFLMFQDTHILESVSLH